MSGQRWQGRRTNPRRMQRIVHLATGATVVLYVYITPNPDSAARGRRQVGAPADARGIGHGHVAAGPDPAALFRSRGHAVSGSAGGQLPRAESLGYLVNHLARMLARALHGQIAPYGVVPGQFAQMSNLEDRVKR